MSVSTRCAYWWGDDVKYGLSVVTPPALEPVTVADVKLNAGITHDEDDVWLSRRIVSARQLAEVFIKRTFIETSWRLTLDELPSQFYLPRPTLRSVTTFKYLDTSGVQQTLDASNYTVDIYTEPGRITPAYNVSWPTYRQHTNCIEVIYKAGYGTTAASVPQGIRDAIVLTVTQWYENRGDEGDKELGVLPSTVKTLLRANAWGFLG